MAPGKKTLGGKTTPSSPPSVLPDHAATMEMSEVEDKDLSSVRAWNIKRARKIRELLGRVLAKNIRLSYWGKMRATVCHHLVIVSKVEQEGHPRECLH